MPFTKAKQYRRWWCSQCQTSFQHDRTFAKHLRSAGRCRTFFQRNRDHRFFHPDPKQRAAAVVEPADEPVAEELVAPDDDDQSMREAQVVPPAGDDSARISHAEPSFKRIESKRDGPAYLMPNDDGDSNHLANPTGIMANNHANGDATSESTSEPIGEDDFATLDGDDMDDFAMLDGDHTPNDDKTTYVEASFDPTKPPVTRIREDFIRYKANSQQNRANLPPKMVAAVELMAILDKEGITFSVYEQIMDWHSKNSYCSSR